MRNTQYGCWSVICCLLQVLFAPTAAASTSANLAREVYHLPVIEVEGNFHAFMLKTAVKKTQSVQYQLLNSNK